MGTTLTGTTPQDTYDSLIKVTDNGPLSGTGKYLSDGLGNDSILALSTARVGIGTATPSYKLDVDVSTGADWAARIKNNSATGYGLYVEGSENSAQYLLGLNNGLTYKMVVQGDGNVGIGTSAPATSLEVRGASPQFRVGISAGSYMELSDNQIAAKTSAGAASDLYVNVSGANTILNRDSGNVGINTASPAVPLDVTGNIRTSTGILFGSDTAAANLLDDYEEGTFTPTIAFGGASVGITYLTQAAKYTKVGNKVSFSVVLTLSNKGSSTGNVSIAGLPYNISPATNADFIPITIGAFINITFNTVPACVGIVNTNTVIFDEYISGGAQTALTNADFANDSTIRIAGFYFV
jgi:hypothetical protein